MKTFQLSHFVVALAAVALLALPLGVALQGAAPPVVFIATLGLASLAAIVYLTFERR